MIEILLVITALVMINEHYISKRLQTKLNEEIAVRHVLQVITEDLLMTIDEYAQKTYELEQKIKNEKAERGLGDEDWRIGV